MKRLEQMTQADRAARVAKLVKNPKTRSAVADRFLPQKYRQQRALNTRLAQPVVPGSGMTNRDLARAREAAVTLQFGPAAEAKAQQQQKDVGGWYDQYKADLQQHARNVGQIGQTAVGQVQGLGGAVRGLDQANLNGQQQAANQDAAGRGASAGNQGQVASDASGVRQAMLASFGSQVAGQGQASSTYADALANVVAPGQKLRGLAVEQRKRDDLKGKMGAFRNQYETEVRDKQNANVIAAKGLGLDVAKAKSDDAYRGAQIDLERGVDPVTGKPLPGKPPSGYGAGGPGLNKYGYSYDEWTGMSEKQRAAARAGKGKGGSGAGPEWLTQQQMSAGLSQLVKLKDFAGKARGGQAFIPGHKGQTPLDRAGAAKKIFASAPSLKDPVLLSAALDAVYSGHLSADTVKRLIAAGYKPKRVAETLGVQTSGQWRAAPRKPTQMTPSPTDTGFPKPIIKLGS